MAELNKAIHETQMRDVNFKWGIVLRDAEDKPAPEDTQDEEEGEDPFYNASSQSEKNPISSAAHENSPVASQDVCNTDVAEPNSGQTLPNFDFVIEESDLMGEF